VKKKGFLHLIGIAKSMMIMVEFFRVEDSDDTANHLDFAYYQRKRYKFLSILVKDAIEKFPKNVDLRIINAFIFKNKLHNEFKAIFELMNCELCSPSLNDQFTIFRRKIEVE
jgi:hypothetical protein